VPGRIETGENPFRATVAAKSRHQGRLVLPPENMLALSLDEPPFGGISSDEDPSSYSDERWGIVTVDQLVDEALGDTEHVGELGQRDSGTHTGL